MGVHAWAKWALGARPSARYIARCAAPELISISWQRANPTNQLLPQENIDVIPPPYYKERFGVKSEHR